MNDDSYNAREAMGKLKLPTTTFYRKVKEGDIPYEGHRPRMRFPKEAIDAIAEVDMKDAPSETLAFKISTVSDVWNRQKTVLEKYAKEDLTEFKTILAWRKVNDDISMQLNKGSAILGWSTFLPLDEDVILELIEDRMKEKDIPPQAIRKWEDQQISVYIPIIEVVPSSSTKRDTEVAALLLRDTIKWAVSLTSQYDIKNWYSIGTSAEGQKNLEALGFKEMNSLYNGKRKAYKLVDVAKPARILSYFLRSRQE